MLRPMTATNGSLEGLDALRTLLTTANGLVAELMADPLVERLLRAFMTLPGCERETILQVLEKDAAWRQIVEETASATGITVRPNPYASLYLHVFDQVTGQPVEPEPLPRDVDVIRLGVESFVRLLPLLYQDAVRAMWSTAARDIVRTSDVEERRLAIRMTSEVQALIAEVDPETAAGHGE